MEKQENFIYISRFRNLYFILGLDISLDCSSDFEIFIIYVTHWRVCGTESSLSVIILPYNHKN